MIIVVLGFDITKKMAGWSKFEDNSCLQQCNETLKSKELKQQCYFFELVLGFLKGSNGNDCFRPLPPRLGNGHCVDLLQLYFVVKQKGGFESISEKNLWDEVGVQYGLGSSFGTAFKLIYDKYLSSIDNWLVNLDKENNLESKLLMELDRDYRDYVSEIMDVKRGSDGCCSFRLAKSGISFIDPRDENNENESKKFGWKKLVMDFVDFEGLNEGNNESSKSKQRKRKICFADAGDSTEEKRGENLKQVKKETSNAGGIFSNGSDKGRFSSSSVVVDDVVKSSENSVASKKCSVNHDEEEMMNVNSGVSKEVYNQKRKRDCFLGMLRWMTNVATDPTDADIDEIPESSKWVSYGNDNSWKQALLAREALFLKKIRTSNTDQFGCQKKHQYLFDHSENLSLSNSYQSEANPPRPRQQLEARLDMQPTASIYTSRPQQRIPVGKPFQADVPEWTGLAIETDSKWLGTQTWPLEKAEKSLSINRDPIGKGRVDNCGCLFPGSTNCVKVHISGRRMKTRYELSSAFYAWKFDKMGEDCSVSWTIDEEKRFRSVVIENPQSSEKCFWKQMCMALPQKSWADQVNYYFNVFKLRRRAHQNRHHPGDIDSDDDETEY